MSLPWSIGQRALQERQVGMGGEEPESKAATSPQLNRRFLRILVERKKSSMSSADDPQQRWGSVPFGGTEEKD